MLCHCGQVGVFDGKCLPCLRDSFPSYLRDQRSKLFSLLCLGLELDLEWNTKKVMVQKQRGVWTTKYWILDLCLYDAGYYASTLRTQVVFYSNLLVKLQILCPSLPKTLLRICLDYLILLCPYMAPHPEVTHLAKELLTVAGVSRTEIQARIRDCNLEYFRCRRAGTSEDPLVQEE